MSDPAGRHGTRAPGAEHTVRPVREGVNPRRLLHLDDAGVALIVRNAAARAIGATLYRQRPEQFSARNPGARGTQERIR